MAASTLWQEGDGLKSRNAYHIRNTGAEWELEIGMEREERTYREKRSVVRGVLEAAHPFEIGISGYWLPLSPAQPSN